MGFWGGGWGWRPLPPTTFHVLSYAKIKKNPWKQTFTPTETLQLDPKNQLKKLQPRGKTCFWVINVWPTSKPKYKNNALKKSNQKHNTFKPVDKPNTFKPNQKYKLPTTWWWSPHRHSHTHSWLYDSRYHCLQRCRPIKNPLKPYNNMTNCTTTKYLRYNQIRQAANL